jgi:hypothetical protein
MYNNRHCHSDTSILATRLTDKDHRTEFKETRCYIRGQGEKFSA